MSDFHIIFKLKSEEDEKKILPPIEVSIVKCIKDCAQMEEQNLVADWRSMSFVRGNNGKFANFVGNSNFRRSA